MYFPGSVLLEQSVTTSVVTKNGCTSEKGVKKLKKNEGGKKDEARHYAVIRCRQ